MAGTNIKMTQYGGRSMDEMLADVLEKKHRRKAKKEAAQKAMGAYEQAVSPGLTSRGIARAIERNAANTAEQSAARELDSYRKSGRQEYDWNQIMGDTLRRISIGNGSLDLQLQEAPGKMVNQTGAELAAKADHAKLNREALEDRYLLEDDVTQIQGMREEDRELLSKYVRIRTDWANPQNVMDSIGIRADLNAKYGKERVAQLAESWERYQNAMSAERTRQEAAGAAESGFLGKAVQSAATVAANTVGALSSPLGYLKEATTRTGRYSTLDPNNDGTMPGQWAGGVREAVSRDMGTVGKTLYQGTMGALDNLARIAAVGGSQFGSLGLAAFGSFGSAVSEASAKGASPGQAVGLGVASAGIEAATEYIPLDNLFKAGKNGWQGAAKAVKNALKQAGVEATEEEISFLGNLLSEAAILREKSDYSRQIGDLVASGMGYAQAREQADRKLWDEAVNTAVTSFVSGGLMSGAQSGGLYLAQKTEKKSKDKATESKQEATASTEAEKETPEQERQRLDRNLREAMAELYPREQTDEERLDQLEAQMEQLVSSGQTETEQGQQAYMELVQEYQELYARTEAEQEERAESLTDLDAPPETQKQAPYTERPAEPENPMANRDERDIGNRSVAAYQFENPEIREYYQDAARGLLADIDSTTPGERTYNDRVYYESGGEKGWAGTRRNTTEDLARFKDQWGYSWEQIRQAEEDMAEGREGANRAIAKRLELLLHDRLVNGYNTVYGEPIPANQDYVEYLRDREFAQERSESFDALMAEGDENAPQRETGGFEAMGAASRGFSGMETYNELLTDENVQPVRPWAVREMEVPKADKDGRRVTEFAANAAGAAATSDAVADALAQLIGEGAMSFESRGMQQSINNAVSELEKRPISEVVGEISERLSEGTIKDGDIEKALVAYNLLSNDGTPDGQARAAAMLPMLGKMANISGRNLNMFGILKKLDPNMQVQAVQDDINRTVKELNKERSGNSVIEGEQMRINEDLAEVFKEAKTEEEKAKALDDIYKDIASRIKPTVWEMFDAWRNLAMLGNFKTHLRNIFGSATFRPAANAKRAVGAVLERVFVDQENRTKAVIGMGTESRELLKWAQQDAKTDIARKMMQYSGTTGDEARSSIAEYRRYLPGKADNLRRKNIEAMEAADMVWKRREYALSLAGFLKARGYTAEQVKMDIMTPGGVPTEVMDEARSYAAKEAMKATFNDRNRFSDAIAKLRVKGNKPLDRAANIIIKGILPFARTPANVTVRAVEYSPAGLAEGFRQLAQDVKTGDATVSDGLDKIASGFTGTGVMLLGAALAHGLIPGVKLVGRLSEEDKEKDSGAIDYSVKIGENYYGISWLAPGAIPLLVGANLYQSIQNRDSIADAWDVLNALGGTIADIIDPLLELSMLSALNDLVETVRYEDSPGEMALAVVTGAATNYFTQALPTIFGQIEEATEKTKSSVYSNADNPMQRSFERTIGRATQRIPGIDLYQVERLDDQGNPVENGPWYQRTFDALINPFSHSESRETAVTREFSRLGVTAPSVSKTLSYTDSNGQTHEDYRLSNEQYNAVQRIQLSNTAKIAEQMLENADYGALTDQQKGKALDYVKDYARELARGEVLPGYDGMSSWMQGISGNEVNTIIGKVAGSDLGDSLTALTTAWREGYESDTGPLEELEQAVQVYDTLSADMQKTVLEGLSGRAAAFVKAHKAGMDTQTFAAMYRKYWDIDQREGMTATRRANAWAAELQFAKEEHRITRKQYDVLRDSLTYSSSSQAEATRFDNFLEAGVSSDDAAKLAELLYTNVKGTGSYDPETKTKNVRDVDRMDAVADANWMTSAERFEALRALMEGPQIEKMETIRAEFGVNAAQYVDIYRANLDGSTKAEDIENYMKLGYTRAEAERLYRIYHPTK